jgi:hypothetical protein
MSLPRAYLAKKLIQPLPIRGGAVLRTIGEAAVRAGAAARRELQPLAAVQPNSCSTRPAWLFPIRPGARGSNFFPGPDPTAKFSKIAIESLT